MALKTENTSHSWPFWLVTLSRKYSHLNIDSFVEMVALGL